MIRNLEGALVISQVVMYLCAAVALVGGILTLWGHLWPLGLGVSLYVASHMVYNGITSIFVIESVRALSGALSGPEVAGEHNEG